MINVEKVLIVSSPKEFYKILIEQNWMSTGVNEFLKAWFRWEQGCVCDAEEHWEGVKKKYLELKEKDLSLLCKQLGCTKIEFEL